MNGKTRIAKHKRHDAANEIFGRILELVKADKELHDAVVRAIDAYADLQTAQAERIRDKARRGDLYDGNILR